MESTSTSTSSPENTTTSNFLSPPDPLPSREERSPSVTISENVEEMEVESCKLIMPHSENENEEQEVVLRNQQPQSKSKSVSSQSVHCKNCAIKNDGLNFSALKRALICNYDEISDSDNLCESCKEKRTIKTKCWCRDYRGILYSLVSGLASTFGGIIVRYMKDFDTFSLATYRFQGIVFPALVMVIYNYFVKKQNVFETIWPVKSKDKTMKFGFTIIRAVIGCLGLYFYFYAIKLMPLADAKVILSCRTIFVIFVAHIFLGEQCGIFPVLTSVIAIAGVAVISRPPILTGEASFDGDTLMGTVFATLSMVAATLSMVVLRYLRGVHVSIVTLAFGFWGTLLSITCSATVERFDVPQSGAEWVLVTCLAVSAFFSQTAITLAMKYEQAGAVVIVGTCDTIMSFILQYFLLGDKPDLYSIFGATLIVICVSLIAFRKWVNSLSERHSIRKKFWFLLK